MADTTPGPEDPFLGPITVSSSERLPEPPFDDDVHDRAASLTAAPRPERRWLPATALVLVSALIGAGAAVGTMLLLDEDPVQVPAITIIDRVETQVLEPTAVTSTAAAVAARVLPSIVTVEVSTTPTSDEFVADATGSGVVIGTDGTLVTNQHVVADATAVRVIFADGRAYDAEIVGGDALTDIAVITIAASGLTAIESGASEAMNIGDVTIAVGSPLGLEGGPSVTVGVLSAFDRRLRINAETELFGLIQTDAPITRGSSGGALVDSQGRLIGITSAIGISDVGAEGLGFAIPVEMMQRIVDDLLVHGRALHAFLGITGATHFEIQADGALAPGGVEVATVLEETAAAEAGLQPGDIIRTFDGEEVVTMERLVVRLRFYAVGDVVTMGIERGSDTLPIEVTLLERPEGL